MKKRGIDLKKEFNEFSRGEKMQIALIAALSQSPKLLLIDEITSVLDVYARKYFIEHLKEFTSKGGTVVMTTNVIDEIQTYSTKTIILKHGTLLLDTEISNIPSFLTKIREVNENSNNPIFKNKNLFFVTTNNDKSKSYLIRNEYIKAYNLEKVLDRRQITLHELFLFYTGHELAEAPKSMVA
jgi:ABC-2 type transport system ATP-binding protein